MKKFQLTVNVLLIVGLLLATAGTASAAIVNATGNAQTDDITGRDLNRGVTESNNVIGFDEQQCVEVASGAAVVDYLIDASSVGQNFTGVNSPGAAPTLPAGTYSSHILHFDPVGANGSVSNASFEFDAPIVAIVANKDYHLATDSTFGGQATYENHLGRRAEVSDTFTITSATSLTITAMSTQSTYTDQLRVITECPGSGGGDVYTWDGSTCGGPSQVGANGSTTLTKTDNGANFDVVLEGQLSINSPTYGYVRHAMPAGFMPVSADPQAYTCEIQDHATKGDASGVGNYGGSGVHVRRDTYGGYTNTATLWFPEKFWNGQFTLKCAWQTDEPTVAGCGGLQQQ